MNFRSITTANNADGNAPAKAEPGVSVRWLIASLALSMLLSSLGTSIANVGLPTLAQAFNASFQLVQWVVLAYLLAITTLIVSVGRLGDMIGRRRLLLSGIILFTAASIGCSVAPTLEWLIAARALQGLGAAIMMALTMAFVAEAVPKERTGSAMGLLGTMSAIGTAMGPSLGGLLIAGLGWRSLFYINLPLGALAFVLAYFYLPADRQNAKAYRSGFDINGTLLFALTLAAYALAVTLGHGSFGLVNLGLLLMAFSIGGVFLAAQSKAESPLIPLEIFRQSTLRAGFIMSALVTTVVMATLVVGPFYLSGALLLDTTHVGLVMSCGPIIAALTGVPAGRLVDRFGAHGMAIAGLVGMAIGTCILPMLPTSFGVTGYIAPLLLVTAGYALFQAANNTAVMTQISANQRGVISGMLNLSRNLGLITGASVMGAVFAFATKSNDINRSSPDAIANGMQVTFLLALALIVLALLAGIASRMRTYHSQVEME